MLEKLKHLGTLPFPDSEMTPEAHARLFATQADRVLVRRAHRQRRARAGHPEDRDDDRPESEEHKGKDEEPHGAITVLQ